MFDVNVGTVVGWEIGRGEPKVSYIPGIIRFIGYDPFQDAKTLGERLRAERWKLGLTQHQLARKLGTTQAIVSLLEVGAEITNRRVLAVVRAFVEAGEAGA